MSLQSQLCPREIEARTADTANLSNRPSGDAFRDHSRHRSNQAEYHLIQEEFKLVTYLDYVLSSQVEVERFHHNPSLWIEGLDETSEREPNGDPYFIVCFVQEIKKQIYYPLRRLGSAIHLHPDNWRQSKDEVC